MIDSFNKKFVEQLRRANLMLGAVGAQDWRAGAAIFGAGAAFASALIVLIKVLEL